MEQEAERESALGDSFDRVVRSLNGRGDVVKTKTTTIRCNTQILERTQTFIVQTYRVRDEGDTILIEFMEFNKMMRVALPPAVSHAIARQYDALTGKSRRNAAKALAQERKAAGVVPFQKK